MLFQLITADGGITFSSLFSEFSDVVPTIWAFFTANTVFKTMVAIPIGLMGVGAVMKLFR